MLITTQMDLIINLFVYNYFNGGTKSINAHQHKSTKSKILFGISNNLVPFRRCL